MCIRTKKSLLSCRGLQFLHGKQKIGEVLPIIFHLIAAYVSWLCIIPIINYKISLDGFLTPVNSPPPLLFSAEAKKEARTRSGARRPLQRMIRDRKFSPMPGREFHQVKIQLTLKIEKFIKCKFHGQKRRSNLYP